MTSKGRLQMVRWVRRTVQGLFLVLFVGTFALAARGAVGVPSRLVKLYFAFDPLVLLSTVLASHAVTALLLLSLITLGLTVILGRFFCGWVCPLGTIHAAASSLNKASAYELVQSEKWSSWNRWKYYLLAGLSVGALFGANWIGVFDPFSLLYRTTVTVLGPAMRYTVEEGSTAVYHSDPHVGPLHATQATEPVYRFFRDNVFVGDRQTYFGGAFISVLFVLLVGLNFYRKRFWCRYLCPLGALLGLTALRPMLRMQTSTETCTECGLCRIDCQGAAGPDKPGEWRPSECFLCLNCTAKCNWESISFSVGAPFRPGEVQSIDLPRRALLVSGLAGIGGLLTLRLPPTAQAKMFSPGLVRPPGSRAERDFLSRCVRCGLCMRVCPTNALQPTVFEAGLEGMWTPRLAPQVGYCEYECNRCGAICPTEAIEPLSLAQKKETKIGLAAFDTSRCLPYAYGRNCMVCEEHCPIPTKAIYFVDTEVTLRDKSGVVLKQPRVDPDRCTGCGICETKCVFRDRPAIRVSSANETRHPDNQPILAGGLIAVPQDSTPVETNDPYGAGG